MSRKVKEYLVMVADCDGYVADYEVTALNENEARKKARERFKRYRPHSMIVSTTVL